MTTPLMNERSDKNVAVPMCLDFFLSHSINLAPSVNESSATGDDSELSNINTSLKSAVSRPRVLIG